MSIVNGLPVNFTISGRARAAIAALRREQASVLADPPALLMIGWGKTRLADGTGGEGPVVGFYSHSELAAVAHGIETVGGLDLLFFVTSETHRHFAGRTLDHDPASGFILVP